MAKPVEPEQPDDPKTLDEPDEPEHTVVIDRDADADVDAHTEVIEREVPEYTEVMERDLPEHTELHTEVMDREVPEHTEVMDRSVPPEHTEVMDRSAPADPESESTLGTVAIVREGAAKSLRSAGRRRRGITLPPVEPGFGREPVAAVGPGAVATYEPRAIPEPPPAAPEAETGPEATRAPAPAMPSVVRRSRRAGLLTLGLFVAAIAVSVAGLIFIGWLVFGG